MDPISIGLLLASMASSAYGNSLKANAGAKDYANNLADMTTQMQQDAQSAEAKNAVLAKYLDASKGFADENQVTAGNEVAGFTGGAQRAAEDANVAKRTAAVTSAIGTGGGVPVAPIAASASGTTREDLANRIKMGFDKAQAEGVNHARLGAIGDTWQGNDAAVADAGNKIGEVNQISRGNMALLPAEQELAAFKYQKPIVGKPKASTQLGSLFQGLGQLGGAYAGSRGYAGSAGAVPGVPTPDSMWAYAPGRH